MKKKLTFGMLAFASAAVLAACGAAPSASSSATGTEAGDALKIGLNFELSGNTASYGTAEKNGAELAIEELKAAGKKLDVVTQDNKSENAEAATVATKLATEEKVNVMVGPATSGATAAAVPNVTSAGVPMITPSGTQDSLTVDKDGKAQEYVFRTTFIDSYQGNVLSNYVTNTLKAKKVVLYYDNSSDYSKGIASNFKANYKGDIVIEETFAAKDTDFQAALSKIKSAEYDVIVLPGYYEEAGSIIKQAREMGIDKTIVSSDGLADDRMIELAGADNVDNVFYISGFSAESSDKAAAFAKAYEEKYGEAPSMFAALAYDAVYMAVEASDGAKNSKEIAANLAKVKDFEGVTGTMTIDEKHNPVKSAVMIGLTDGKVTSSTVVEAK